ncbi:MAG: prepilin-type N-terminal cleavage/methylation domain-containing protein [Ruminococcus sp.]|nr:prepilin-type N-terminal cleavage/methylation domain-containing protein [Ruminococcus sp.]
MNNKNKKGFTLIELITVIAIIGILATILVPSIYNYVKKARITAAIADTKVIRSSIETALVERLTLSSKGTSGAFNKVLFLDQTNKNTGKNTQVANLNSGSYEIVGTFTSYSWNSYRTGKYQSSASQDIDLTIAGALDGEFTEKWDTGAPVNPMKYNNGSLTCAQYLKDNNTNFALVVVYNRTGNVRMIQIYRKGILVTYVNGDYVVNTSDKSYFIGSGTWDKIYKDAEEGKTAPEEFCKINLSNCQIRDGKLQGWY